MVMIYTPTPDEISQTKGTRMLSLGTCITNLLVEVLHYYSLNQLSSLLQHSALQLLYYVGLVSCNKKTRPNPSFTFAANYFDCKTLVLWRFTFRKTNTYK